MSEQEVLDGREEEVSEGQDRHEGYGQEADRDAAPAQGRAKRRTVRRRRPRITRPVEIRIGKRRIGVDGWELSAGILTYWIDGVHTILPVTKKIEIREHGPEVERRLPPELLRRREGPTEEEKIAEVEAAVEKFRRRRSQSLGQMMGHPIRRPAEEA